MNLVMFWVEQLGRPVGWFSHMTWWSWTGHQKLLTLPEPAGTSRVHVMLSPALPVGDSR
jgi:hypothetical protein